jgi:hypothetical protein
MKNDKRKKREANRAQLISDRLVVREEKKKRIIIIVRQKPQIIQSMF